MRRVTHKLSSTLHLLCTEPTAPRVLLSAQVVDALRPVTDKPPSTLPSALSASH